ncbi:MAG: hypothetical protein E2O79_06270 [Caldithrix sp.]|nr:MAG: hypothetical protein E2O79_06270 [Caldithrix sp.]
MQVGIEFNPKAEEIAPLFTLFLLTESEKRPALFLGTSSDRIGSPAGEQSYFVTVSKYLPFLSASLYGSLNYSEWDNAFNFPFGAAIEIGKGFSIRSMYDGDRSHLLLNYFSSHYGVSFMYVWFETLGLSFSVGL